MVRVPVLRSLRVDNYGLFPGLSNAPIDLSRPLTVVLGANGIGKSSLVHLLYRMLTGPFDIPAFATSQPLGSASLEERELSRNVKASLSHRVNDARESTSELTFGIGDSIFVSTRSLYDLRLLRATCNGREVPDERALQVELKNASELGSFSDFLLLLRYISFYQEDRRPLLWDEGAQRQVLRPLFLSPSDSLNWVAQERSILKLDSERRNLSAAASRARHRLGAESARLQGQASTLAEIEPIQTQLAELDESTTALFEELRTAGAQLTEGQRSLLQAEADLEQVRNSVQMERSRAIVELLPSADANLRYLVSRIVSGGICPGCGQESEALRRTLSERLDAGRCPICGADDEVVVNHVSEDSPVGLYERLESATQLVERLREEQAIAEAQYKSRLELSAESRRLISELEGRLERLEALLPDDERAIADRRDQLNVWDRELARMDADLLEMRGRFTTFMENKTSEILSRAVELQTAFARYASQFLAEESSLTWSPVEERVGQLGNTVKYPSFAVEMTGSNFTSQIARSTEDSVSESQKEFIDLAFRMALVDVASESPEGTLVIDSPDYSLDAVFEPRAARTLARFTASRPNCRVIVTSNLSSGGFIPELVNETRSIGSGEPEVVDLFEVGVRTAAVRDFESDYLEVRDRVLTESGL